MSLLSLLNPWGCCQAPSGGDFQEATMRPTSRRSASLSAAPFAANMCCLPPNQVAVLYEQPAKADKADTEPSFSAPSRAVRKCTERKGSSAGPSTPRSGRVSSSRREGSTGIGIIFSIREESGELEVDSLVPTGPSRGFVSIIRRGDVLVEVDEVAIHQLEHAEIGRLIIGPPGTTARLVFRREVASSQTGEVTHETYAADIVRQPNRRPAGDMTGFTYA